MATEYPWSPLPSELAPRAATRGPLADLLFNLRAGRMGPSVPLSGSPIPSFGGNSPAVTMPTRSLPGMMFNGQAAANGGTIESLGQFVDPAITRSASSGGIFADPAVARSVASPVTPYGPYGPMPATTAPTAALRGPTTIPTGPPVAGSAIPNAFAVDSMGLGSPTSVLGRARAAISPTQVSWQGRPTGINGPLAGFGAATAIGFGANMVAGTNPENEALGDRMSALQTGAMLGSPFGVPGAAVGALGAWTGDTIAQALPGGENKRFSNIWGNIAGTNPDGTLEAQTSNLDLAGITPGDLVRYLGMENGDTVLANALADKGFPGATHDPDDGKPVLSGDALKLVEEFRQVGAGEAGGMGNLLADMARRGFDEDQSAAAMQAYAAAKAAVPEGGTFDETLARRNAVDAGENYTTQQQVDQDAFSRQLAYQQQIQEYMAPVTGRMRQQTDAYEAMMNETLANSNLPPAMTNAFQMQIASEAQGQRSIANAYDRQLAIAPMQAQFAEAQSQQDQIASALWQQTMQSILYPQSATGAGGLDLGAIDPSLLAATG